MSSLLLLSALSALSALVAAGYWEDRSRLISEEADMFLGSDIVLDAEESIANDALLAAKSAEYMHGFQAPDNAFPPAMHFFQAKPLIEKSQVFKLIRMMPKGGALHAHESALVSTNYLLKNVTYREDLFACADAPGTFVMRFLERRDADADVSCDWTPLSDLRRVSGDTDKFDRWLEQKLTLVTANPTLTYSDANAVWTAFEAIFKTVSDLVTYRPVFQDYIYQFLSEFYEDGVMYVEIRSNIKGVYELNGKVLDSVEIVTLFQNVVEKFSKSHPDFLGVKMILSMSRSVDNTTLRSHLQRYRRLKQAFPEFIAGFDLVGQEDKGRPLSEFIGDLEKFTSDGNKLFFHAGETSKYKIHIIRMSVEGFMLIRRPS